MKLISFLLVILTLTLSAIPCADGFEDSCLSADTENHDDQHQDLCSVFCTCACCGIVCNSPQLDFFENQKPAIKELTPQFIYKKLIAKGFVNTIWHPPIAA
jgi:hypothetical protein